MHVHSIRSHIPVLSFAIMPLCMALSQVLAILYILVSHRGSGTPP